MRVLNIILILFVGNIFVTCNQKKRIAEEAVTTEFNTFSEEFEDIDPPPDDLTTSYETVEDWLTGLCDTEKPAKPVDTYHFGLWQSGGSYTLYLVGQQRYQLDKYTATTKIEFQPAELYFPLPEKTYSNRSVEQVWEQLASELRTFTRTEKFRNSFFAGAKRITTDFKGPIWSNPALNK